MFLTFDGHQGNPIYDDFLAYMPDRFFKEHVLPKAAGLPHALRMDIFSIEENGVIYEKIKRSLPQEFNEEAFIEGKGGILLTPQYKKGNARPKEDDKDLFHDTIAGNRLRKILEYYHAYDFQVDERYEKLYDKTKHYDGLKRLRLYEKQDVIQGYDNPFEAPMDPIYHKHDVEILAHLHSLPTEGIWPFSYDRDYPVMLFSREGMRNLYGYPSFVSWKEQKLLEGPRRLGAMGLGESYFYFHTYDPSPETEMALRNLAHPHNMYLQNLVRLKDQLYEKGLAGALLSGLLGLVVLLIAAQILYQGFKSELEEEEAHRIGTLQSMGLDSKKMEKSYLKRATEDILLAWLYPMWSMEFFLSFSLLEGRD